MADTQREFGRVISTGQQPEWALARPGYLRQHIHNMGLLPRLLIAELLLFAVLSAGGVILMSQMASSLRSNIQQERLLLGKAVAEDLDAALAHSISELQGLTERYRLALARGDPAEIQGVPDLPVGISAVFNDGILITGPKGKVLATDRRHPALAGLDLYRYWPSLWDQGRRRSGVLAAGFHMEGQASPSVGIAVPVGGGRDGEYVVGIVDTAYSYPAQIIARAVRLGQGGHADVVDQRGIALFSTQPEHLLVTSDHPASYRRLLGRGEAVIEELPHEHAEEGTPEGEPHLMAFVPLQTLPWAISFGDTVSEAFAPVRQLWVGGLGFMALLMGLAFAATVFVGRRLVQPVKALSVAARGMAAGEQGVTVRFPWGGEIGELGRSLETMRLRLQAWGSQLEEQVHERTSELEERNNELRVLYETLQRKEEQLHALLGKVLSAQEDERKRVSRELHDGVGQALSALSMGLERLEQAGPDQWPHLHKHVADLREVATSTLSDLRRLVIALRPAALDDLGLVPAIRRYGELYLRNAGIDFQVQEDGPDTRLEPSLESVIYRVVQEAINNAARHSGATQVRIRLKTTDSALAVTVEDNGRGFDSTLATSGHGEGLQGMQERATMAGGKLTLDSRPGRGTMVRLEIPLTERVNRQGDGYS